ncbi:MAG TPA: hypothetical protein VK094_00200 [Pseudogracilibacillus sp.]|nr:hypothetical protein [Pseudogracilibacillus sp.]
MSKNLSNLNGYLFEQLDRLNQKDMTETEFENEIKRSKAISQVSNNVIQTASLVLEGQKIVNNLGEDQKLPKMLE